LKQAEQRLTQAQAATRAAEHALELATQALHAANSQSNAQVRAMKQAQLGEQAATSRATIERLEAARARATEAQARTTALSTARGELLQLDAALPGLHRAVDQAQQRLNEKQTEETLAENMLAFARWTDAKAKQKSASLAKDEVLALRTTALTKEAQARQLDAQAEAEAAKRRALPSEAQRRQFSQLEKDLAVAKAQLGGAFRVAIRPHSALTLRTTVDERPPVDETKLMAERSFEAERRVVLAIGNLVDIEVTGGTSERRAELEALQRRWSVEVLPTLQTLGVSSLAELDAVYSEEAARDAAVRKLRDDVALLRQQNQAALQRADFLQQQVAAAPTNEQVASYEAAFGVADRASLEGILASLGAGWEEQVTEIGRAHV
jgi:hypothetical protein